MSSYLTLLGSYLNQESVGWIIVFNQCQSTHFYISIFKLIKTFFPGLEWNLCCGVAFDTSQSGMLSSRFRRAGECRVMIILII